MSHSRSRTASFSVAEVMIALGVIAFAVVSILAIFPIALSSGHSAQDETRAPHIAQAIISSLASQAQTQFNNVQIRLPDNTIVASFNLTLSAAPPPLYADIDGNLTQNGATAAYAVIIFTNNAPPGYPVGYANQVTVRVSAPANAPAANQTYRDYVRIISKS